MERNTKDWIQHGSAVSMLASAVVLTFLCFFTNNHDVTDGVLVYVAQCLGYAAGVFGVTTFAYCKYGELKGYIDKRMESEKEGKK